MLNVSRPITRRAKSKPSREIPLIPYGNIDEEKPGIETQREQNETRKTVTAPVVKRESKSSSKEQTLSNRQPWTAPIGHNEHDVDRSSFTAPTIKVRSRTRNTSRVPVLPPISGNYNDNYSPPTLKLCKDCRHFFKYFRTQEITLMADVAGSNVDLYDVRKTQRRLKVLININDVDSPQRYPIRRNPLPQGVCYVCSHLDVDGKYQHPHSYLFRKGFFGKCQHHPKTPYPTLIESSDGDRPEDVFNFNKQLSDEELKLSVSVRVKSRRDNNTDSPIPIFGQTHFDTAVLNGVKLESHVGQSAKFQLPSIFADENENKNLSGQTSLRSSRNSKLSEKRSQVSRQTGSITSRTTDSNETWKNNVKNAGSRQSWKHNNKIKVRRSEDNWKINPTISDRSWLEADGYVRREMSDEEEEDDEEEGEPDDSQIRPKSFAGSETQKSQSSIRPQSENIVSPASSRLSRPKGAKRSSEFGDEDEGHLKYHHRADNESLPHDGFSIASRESSIQTSIRSRHNSKLSEPELALIGSQISRRTSEADSERMQSQSSSSFILQKLAGGMANHWCTCQDIDYSKVKCEECLKVGEHEKWCVHAKSISHQGNCPHCGKPIMKTSKRASNMSFRGSQAHSTGKQSQQSEEKHVKFEDDRDEILINQAKFFGNKRDDDDADDMGSIDGDDVWTATEHLYEGGIDPNIHKRAYLKALFELRMSKLSKISELDESWTLDRISKPTFSYFKLRPGQEKAFPDGPKNIGLTPDNSHLPAVRKSMKHIFGGKIKVDDFYPGGKKNPRVTVTAKREKKQQTMPVHTYNKAV